MGADEDIVIPNPLGGSAVPESPARVARRKRGARAAWIAIALGIAFDLVLFCTVGERMLYDGRVLPGVSVPAIDAGGKSTTATRSALRRVADTLEHRVLRANAGPTELHAAAADLGVRLDVDATLAEARRDGHSDNPLNATAGFLLRRARNDRVRLHVDIDMHAVDAAVARWQREATSGVRDAGIAISGTTVSVTDGRAGRGIDVARGRTLLAAAAIDPHEADTLTIPRTVVQPQIASADAEAVAARARRILTGTYDVRSGGHDFTITALELSHALNARAVNGHLVLRVDADRLRAAVSAPIRAIGTAPVDATFTLNGDGTVAVVPSHDGLGPDFAAIGQSILGGQRSFDVPFAPAHPVRDTAWAQHLGITGLVSTFTTHHPCCAARVVNIHRAADIMNGAIVEPGGLFSLNKAVGPRTAARGFQQAPVIYEGEFAVDFGGGVSQLSTTTFNAAWWAGFEIVRHQPHSLYITRYPMGREATISYPQVDLQWRNDSQHGVWVRTSYTATSITVSLYGNTDGRSVRETYGTCSVGPETDSLTEPRCLHMISTTPVGDNRVVCPVKNPSDDPDSKCATLGPGETAAGSTGHAGYSVEFFRTITEPRRDVRVERFSWNYTMMPNVTLVGEGEPTTTASSTTTPSSPPGPTTSAPGSTSTTG